MLIAGLPGAGKSSLARDLADRARFLVIRSDEVRKELAREARQGSAPAAFGEDLYASDWNERTYAECLRRAEDSLFQGRRVLIDASFRQEAHRRLFLEAAYRWGITGCLLLCRAEPAVIRERLASRQGDASDADGTIYEEIARALGRARTHDSQCHCAKSRPAEAEPIHSPRPSLCSESSVSSMGYRDPPFERPESRDRHLGIAIATAIPSQSTGTRAVHARMAHRPY